MRLVFQLEETNNHTRKWWVVVGKKVEFKPEGTTVLVEVDGEPVARSTNSGLWIVNRLRYAVHLHIDDLPYTLEGNAITGNYGSGQDYEYPCIFCGKKVKHINDGGTAWILSTRVDGEVLSFLYCNEPCSPSKYAVWTCVHDDIDLVGESCCVCGGERSEVDRDLPQFKEFQ